MRSLVCQECLAGRNNGYGRDDCDLGVRQVYETKRGEVKGTHVRELRQLIGDRLGHRREVDERHFASVTRFFARRTALNFSMTT